jgi:hypothetical protein
MKLKYSGLVFIGQALNIEVLLHALGLKILIMAIRLTTLRVTPTMFELFAKYHFNTFKRSVIWILK